MTRMRDEKLRRTQNLVKNHPVEDGECEKSGGDSDSQQRTNAPPINAQDKSLLLDFDTELSRHKKPTNHTILLKDAVRFCKYRNPPTPNGDPASAHNISLRVLLDDPEAGEEFEEWVLVLHTKDGERIAIKSEEHFRNMVRQFGELMGEDGRPPHIENIKSTSPRKSNQGGYDPTPKRTNIHHWGETVVDILDSPDTHLRNKAIIAVTWDAGSRPSETFAIKAGHLTDNRDHFVLDVIDSKTEDRTPHLMASMPYLRKWLLKLDRMTEDVDVSTSPLSIPPEQKIWTHLDSSVKLSDSSFEQIGRKVGNKLGFNRPTNLKQFRKSRASVLAAQEGITEQTLRTRFGWKHGSTAPAHYITKFSDEANQQIADADGGSIEISEEGADPAPIKCSACESWSPRHLNNCYWCGADMEGEQKRPGVSELDRIKSTGQQVEKAKAALMKQVDDFELSGRSMELALRVVEVMEKNPNIAKDTVAFALLTEHEDWELEHAKDLVKGNYEGLHSIFEDA